MLIGSSAEVWNMCRSKSFHIQFVINKHDEIKLTIQNLDILIQLFQQDK